MKKKCFRANQIARISRQYAKIFCKSRWKLILMQIICSKWLWTFNLVEFDQKATRNSLVSSKFPGKSAWYSQRVKTRLLYSYLKYQNFCPKIIYWKRENNFNEELLCYVQKGNVICFVFTKICRGLFTGLLHKKPQGTNQIPERLIS